MNLNRLDPSMLSPDELEELTNAFARARPGQVALVNDRGERTEIPGVLFHHLMRIVKLMGEKKVINLIPQDQAFTTQAAANYLGVSRQYLVDLLERGEMSFHKVGSHRRVLFHDLLSYEKQRDQARRKGLDTLSEDVDRAGLYDADYTGDE